MDKTTITWVNHASYLLRFNKTVLLVDPWLEGQVFNNGWQHQSSTVVTKKDLSEVTHIWFSHEHPDHFSPPNLISMLKNREGPLPTILFQKTLDGRVSTFCRKKLGCKVVELEQGVRYELGANATITVYPHGQLDSYSVCQFGGHNFLNVNDCVIKANDIKAIASLDVDFEVMFCQFSYASWISNIDGREKRIKAVQDKLETMRTLSAALNIKHVCPFASFIRFCHIENIFMNDAVPEISTVASLINEKMDSDALILYPGDIWNPARYWSNANSIQKYNTDSATVFEPTRSSSVTLEELLHHGEEYLGRIRNKNGKFTVFLIGLLSVVAKKIGRIGLGPVNMHVFDIDEYLTFDLLSGLLTTKSGVVVDASLSSDSLRYILLHEWGYSTLSVNGRFQTSHARGHLVLARAFSIGQINSVGSTLIKHTKKRLSSAFEPSIHDQESSHLKQ